MISTFLSIVLWLVVILLSVALLTLYERKLLAAYQRRVGPDTVGVLGVLQPVADAVKLITKQTSSSANSNTGIFYIAPLYALTITMGVWSIIISMYIDSNVIISWPSEYSLTNYQWLAILALLSLTIYSVLLLGWAANSAYAFVGSLRSSAAMVSYELVLAGTALFPILFSSTYSLYGVIFAQYNIGYWIMLLPVWVCFVVSTLAEAGRVPFDLVEAESELVAGYMSEHASVAFVLLFLTEYASILLFSVINALLWFGTSSYSSLILAMSLVLTIVILARALLPRLRYDQLIGLCWLQLLPIVFVVTVVMPIIYYIL